MRNRFELAGLVLVAAMACASSALASSEYPGVVEQHLSLSYTPACSLCHQDGRTGSGTVTTPFGKALRDRGAVSGNPASITAALDQMMSGDVDSDGDGVSDVEELVAGTSPNGTEGGASTAAPEPVFGCGASIAPRSASSPRAAGLALALLGASVALRRKKRALLPLLLGALGALSVGCYEVSYVSPEICSTGLAWTGGETESPLMNPGEACIACHADEGPSFRFAGTVFAKRDEPDSCFGVSGATIVITGADGRSIEIDPNAAGNFYSSLDVALPYRAMIVAGDQKAIMTTPQTSGDCNGCHTREGRSGAPGRIVSP